GADGSAAADADNKEAGKLFASGNNAIANAIAGAGAAAAGKAVSAVSGDQILKAIVDAAESNAGKKATDATNAVEAAIGGDGDGAAAFGDGDGKIGKKNEQIAAAIVLRGLAKSGKFANTNNAGDDKVQAAVKSAGEWLKEMHTAADATAKAAGEGGNDLIANVAAAGADSKGAGAKADKESVTGIAQGMKGIVEAAKKAGVELKPEAAAAAGGNKEAGKLFASGNNGAGAAAAAGKAVSAVSGDQILKAIVDAAETAAGKKAAGQATNAVEAAIGDGDAAADFGDDKIGKKNDQIAAAIVLRGLAKGGKFAVKNY
ncbi:variable large family protein, partial [Borreliella afzelii]